MVGQPTTCKGCPLFGVGQGFVPASCSVNDKWDIPYKLLVQGEAPGAQEIVGGKPFVGPAGWWLKKNVLANVGLNEEEVVYDNTLRCLPSKNAAGEAYPVGAIRGAAEVHCRQYDAWDSFPRAIPLLLVGGKALRQRLGHDSIADWHGHIEVVGGRVVGCTFHPAAVMRQPNLLPLVVRETYNVLTAAANPGVLQHPPVAKGGLCVPSTKRPMVFDLEWNAQGAVTATGIATCATEAHSAYGDWSHLIKAYTGTLVGHNIIDADFRTIVYSPPSFKPEHVFDTKLAAHLVHAHFAGLGLLSLGDLVRYYRPTSNWKEDTADLLEYNGRDCAYNFYLYERLVEDLEATGQMHLMEKQQRLGHMARLMNERGIKIDSKRVMDTHAHWDERKKELAAAFPFNPNSPKQVLEWAKGEGIRLPNTRETTIQRHAYKHETLRRLYDYKAVGVKPITTWFPLEGDYIYPQLNVTGTDVARFSCASPNVQNIPPDLRGMIVPRDPGLVLLSFDFSQIENRCIAWLAGDKKMLADFASGLDFHRLSASRIFNKRYEEVSDEERYEGKKTIHATNYGETSTHLAERLFGSRTKVDRNRAERLQAAYFGAYPTIAAWQVAVSSQLEAGNIRLRNPHGRLRYVYGRDVHERLKKGCHYLGCSTAAEIVNQRALDVWDGLDMLPILIVHDEIVWEVERGKVKKVAAKVKEILERPVKELGGLVIPVKGKAGENYAALSDCTQI